MLDTATAPDLSSFFEVQSFDPDTFRQQAELIFQSSRSQERFEELVSDYQSRDGDPLRLAIGQLIVGEFSAAVQSFSRAPDSKYRRYYAAQALLGLGRRDEALAELKAAAAQGWDPIEIDLQIAGVQMEAGRYGEAEAILRKHERAGQDRAGWYYVKAFLLEVAGEGEAALDAYDKALTLDPQHAESLFRAARLNDQYGNDLAAHELYEKLAAQPRASTNALINLAVLYEDEGRFEEAADCLRRVLIANPNDARARLFLRDVDSSRTMVIDDGGERRQEVRNRVLEAPVTELELSMRARNCLKKMRVQTVADLIKLSEEELMSYKNFGESSLAEIKAALAKRGLHLGQKAEEVPAPPVEVAPPRPVLPPGAEAVLHKPVSELELSVRARRCLQRLNIVTLGDLITHTEQELLATRNFGVTSLNEIRARLADFGLALPTKK